MAQQRIQRAELIVHRDAQGLEDAAHREIDLVLVEAWQRSADGGGEFPCRGECVPSQHGGEFGRARFISVGLKQVRQRGE